MYNEIYYLNEDAGTDEMISANDKNVQGKLTSATKLEQIYMERYMQNYVFQANIQSDLYGTIQFPSLPTNFQMLMGKMDFPEKAMKNPNDALFMDPMKIDATSADDIGKQLFNSKSFRNKTGLKSTLNSAAFARQFESVQMFIDEFTDRYIYEDTASSVGFEEKVKDVKGVNRDMMQMTQDVKSAITTYIRRSTDIIKPLLELTAGGSAVKDVMKAINTANSTSMDNVRQWVDNVSKIKKDFTEGLKNYQLSIIRDQNDTIKDALDFASCVMVSKVPDGNNRRQYTQNVMEFISKMKNQKALDTIVVKYCTDFKKWIDFKRAFQSKDEKAFPLNLKKLSSNASESAGRTGNARRLDEDSLTMADETLKHTEVTPIDYDRLYSDLVNYLSGEISSAVGERERWTCFKTMREDMKKLKDRADAEIKKKIELVCKTGGQVSLIKWPMKAEGLLSMWERYSGELQIRMDNRINQLMGLGGVETGSALMLEDFLKSTYPQIVAMLITYRTLFEQIGQVYRQNFVPSMTLEDTQDIKKECAEEFGLRIKELFAAFYQRPK